MGCEILGILHLLGYVIPVGMQERLGFDDLLVI